MPKRNNIIYWIATILLSLGMLGGGLGQLFRAQPTVDGIVHLGYPPYLTSILGTWKILGTIALLVPAFRLLKEWAYAGFFFAMTGAAISHIVSGDSVSHYISPLIFSVLIVVSWYFRPADRRLAFINQ